MRYDCIVGNPPYNNGMDLDFMYKAFKNSEMTVMVVPAKFQITHGDQQCDSKMCGYQLFQDEVVPYIKIAHYWFDACECFPIKITGGICFYLADHRPTQSCLVYNHSKNIPEFSGVEVRDLQNRDTFNNLGFDIFNKVKSVPGFEQLKLDFNSSDAFTVYSCDMVSPSNRIREGGSCWLSSAGDTYVNGVCQILPTGQRLDELSDRDRPVFSSNSLDECKSFVSYFYSKFFRFLAWIVIGKQAFINNDWGWRYIPNPGPFDHLFTDEELYRKYNLSESDISLIERVIRDRYQSNPSCTIKDFWILRREQLYFGGADL